MKQIKITKPEELAQKLCREHGIAEIPFIVDCNGTVHINTKSLDFCDDAEQLRHVTFNLENFCDDVQEAIVAKIEKEIPDEETEQYYEQLNLTPVVTQLNITADGKVDGIVIDFS